MGFAKLCTGFYYLGRIFYFPVDEDFCVKIVREVPGRKRGGGGGLKC